MEPYSYIHLLGGFYSFGDEFQQKHFNSNYCCNNRYINANNFMQLDNWSKPPVKYTQYLNTFHVILLFEIKNSYGT
jgi:hypothetical protein